MIFDFHRFRLVPDSKPLSISAAVEAVAAAEVGPWVTDMGDARAWSSIGRLAIERARVRLYQALTSGAVSAYARAPGEPDVRIVDAAYWRRGNPAWADLPVFTAEMDRPEIRLAQYVEGPGVTQEVEGQPIFLVSADLDPITGPLLDTLTVWEDETGDPGRPEKGAVLYVAEMERRGKEGILNETINEEARSLWEWFREAHPLRSAPTVGTIENRIRRRFWKLRPPTK